MSNLLLQNTYKSVKSGVGEKIEFLKLTTEEVKAKVTKVIEDPRYTSANRK